MLIRAQIKLRETMEMSAREESKRAKEIKESRGSPRLEHRMEMPEKRKPEDRMQQSGAEEEKE